MESPAAPEVRRYRLLAAALVLLRPGLGPLYMGAPVTAVAVELLGGVLYLAIGVTVVLELLPPPVLLGLLGVSWVASFLAWGAITVLDPTGFQPRWYHRWWGYLGFAVGGLLANSALVVATRACVVEPFRIPGGSMNPALEIGDHVLVARGPFQDPIERGSVIVFRYPLNREQSFIKRVIALPGDTVRMEGGVPVVNGAPAPRRPAGTRTLLPADCVAATVQAFDEGVGARPYTVLEGPTRGSLRDRPAEELTVPAGHLFVLGDNRDNSLDSRVWGFVPLDDVKGTARFVWLSWDECAGEFRWERLGHRL